MSTLSIYLPNSLHSNLRELAEREGISVDQFIATAVAEKMSEMMTGSYIEEQASLEKYEAALARAPDVEPEEYDKLPCS